MNTFWHPYPKINDDLKRVDEIITASVQTKHSLIREALDDLLSRRGKMLRPGLVLLSARFRRNGHREDLPDKIYRIAAAVELLHTATLVHDDVLDQAAVRRGGETLNAAYGSKTAVLLGDFLFSTCFRLVADQASTENARLLAAGIGHICSGEILQAEDVDLTKVSIRRYRRRIAGKTALLFSLSLHIGARENDIPRSRAYRLARIGHAMGMAFQITDDVLDYQGHEGTLGKPAGYDLLNSVYTLPLLRAVQKDGDELRALLSNGNRALGRIVGRIEELGGFSDAREEARLYTDRALRDAEKLPQLWARDVLLDVSRRLLGRST
jgi:heptaprenyl diphosphate synthase